MQINGFWAAVLSLGAIFTALIAISAFFKGLWSVGKSLYKIEEAVSAVPTLKSDIELIKQIQKKMGEELTALAGSVKNGRDEIAQGRKEAAESRSKEGI